MSFIKFLGQDIEAPEPFIPATKVDRSDPMKALEIRRKKVDEEVYRGSFINFLMENQRLDEKLIMPNGGRRTGQVVFMAGGAGSGKGFVVKNYMDTNSFKVFDVDRWKQGFLDSKKIMAKFPELKGLDLRNPVDVGKLHVFVKDHGIHLRALDLFYSNLDAGKGLPNIIFDITMKEERDILKILPDLLNVGYKPTDIHIVWALTSFDIAVKQNAGRSRVVPDDILFQTHDGAAKTATGFITRGSLPKGVEGEFIIVTRDGFAVTNQSFRGKETKIKDFTYFRLKRSGRPIDSMAVFKSNILNTIEKLSPGTLVESTVKKLSDVYRKGDAIGISSDLAYDLAVPATGTVETVPEGNVGDRAVIYVKFGRDTIPLSLSAIKRHTKKRR